MEAHDQAAAAETPGFEDAESTYKAPNKLARVVMVFGIVAIVAILNFLTSLPPKVINGGDGPGRLPPLPYPAKEIVASKWLNTKDGKPIKLADLKGKIVLLEFWRFQCHSCESAIPMVKDLEEKFAGDLHVVTVHTAVTEEEKDEQSLRDYLKQHKITSPVAIDNDKTTMEKKYGYAITTPTFLLINKKGNVVDYQASMNATAMLEAEIKAMLNGSDLEKEAKAKNAPTSTPAGKSIFPGKGALPALSSPSNLPTPPQTPQ